MCVSVPLKSRCGSSLRLMLQASGLNGRTPTVWLATRLRSVCPRRCRGLFAGALRYVFGCLVMLGGVVSLPLVGAVVFEQGREMGVCGEGPRGRVGGGGGASGSIAAG